MGMNLQCAQCHDHPLVDAYKQDHYFGLFAYPNSSFLFKAGKDYELLPLNGFTHMVPDPQVTINLESRIVAFFKQHLGDPR